MVSEAETESIFMEPIHLSSAVAAKRIIREGKAGSGPCGGESPCWVTERLGRAGKVSMCFLDASIAEAEQIQSLAGQRQ